MKGLRFAILGALCAMASGCLSFQTRDNPLGLRPQRTLKLDGSLLHYREMGQRGHPAVVFLHGYGSASVVWIPLMQALSKAGYHCLALDLPGFGLSDKRKGNYKTRHIARVVGRFLRRKGVRKADVIAHSWGSSVALAFALQSPRMVRRIVINSGWVYTAQIVPAIRWSQVPLLGEILYALFYRELTGEKLAHSVYDARKHATPAVIAVIRKAYKRPGALAAALAVARGMDFRSDEKRYGSIKQPVLLQWGRQDRIALPFYARRLAAHLPHARLVYLERCGHMPMLERPHAFVRNIVGFLGPARRARKTP